MSNILKKIEKKSKNKRIELNDGQYRIKRPQHNKTPSSPSAKS